MKIKYITTAQELFNHFTDYITATKGNPVIVKDYVGKDGMQVNREKERPLTMVGFEVYLSKKNIINSLTDYDRNTNNAYADFVPVMEVIKKTIEDDCLTGAMVGIFNPSITARKLGLADKKEVKHDVYDVTLKID